MMLNSLEKNEIQKQAGYLREDLGLSEEEVIKDIPPLIAKLGYKYVESKIELDYSGYSKSLPDLNFEICFNSNRASWGENYKRFTLAHELGHVRMPSHVEILRGTTLHRSKADHGSADKIEKEADYFAINFLAPKISFQNKIGSSGFVNEIIVNLANHFGISLYSAILRYLELNNGTYSAIIVNKISKKIEYEHRSASFYKGIGFRSKEPLDSLDMVKFEGVKNVCLNEWYPDLNDEIEASISVLDLGYRNMVAVLIEPLDSELENYLDQEKDDY